MYFNALLIERTNNKKLIIVQYKSPFSQFKFKTLLVSLKENIALRLSLQ